MPKRYIVHDNIAYRLFLWMKWKVGVVKDGNLIFGFWHRPIFPCRITVEYEIDVSRKQDNPVHNPF